MHGGGDGESGVGRWGKGVGVEAKVVRLRGGKCEGVLFIIT